MPAAYEPRLLRLVQSIQFHCCAVRRTLDCEPAAKQSVARLVRSLGSIALCPARPHPPRLCRYMQSVSRYKVGGGAQHPKSEREKKKNSLRPKISLAREEQTDLPEVLAQRRRGPVAKQQPACLPNLSAQSTSHVLVRHGWTRCESSARVSRSMQPSRHSAERVPRGLCSFGLWVLLVPLQLWPWLAFRRLAV